MANCDANVFFGGGGGGGGMILIGQFFALGSPGCNLKSTGKAFHLSI